MFSCCERKFYTVLENFDVSNVNEYKMFIKYNACPMCEGAIIDLRNRGYVDDIIYGIEKEYDATFKANYDMLAEDISNGIMGIDY